MAGRVLNLVNRQPVEQKLFRSDGVLEVFNVWKTIQGEGPYAGVPSVFVRLAGCNLRCALCDTDYTSNRGLMAPTNLYGRIRHVNLDGDPRLVVLTGGEPFRQNFLPLARMLLQSGIGVQVETNGTLWQDEMPLLPLKIVCSPKTPEINEQLFPYITALKYVIRAGEVEEDGLPARALGGARPWRPIISFKNGHMGFPVKDVYLQPLDEGDEIKNRKNMEATLESCLRHGYTFGVQLHKLAGVE